MNLKEISTIDLVRELARRAEHFDALAAFAASVNDEKAPNVVPKDFSARSVSTPYKRKHLLTSKMVYDVLKIAGRPLTIDETFKRIGRGTKAGVIGQFRRLIKEKKAVRLGNAKPFAYQAIGE